jgi:hypothetical protein
VHQTKSLDLGLDLIDDRIVCMVETQVAQAKVWEHCWLSFQMDIEGRQISTRFACSRHLLTSNMFVSCDAVPIANAELPYRNRFGVSHQAMFEWEKPGYWVYQRSFIHCKASSDKNVVLYQGICNRSGRVKTLFRRSFGSNSPDALPSSHHIALQ